MNLVSRGANGFLALTVAPDEAAGGHKLTLGLANLPADQATCHSGEDDCSFKWIHSADLEGTNLYPRAGNPEVGFAGFANLAHIGSGGEDGDRFLIGWADNIQFQGRSSQYYMVEVDTDGKMYGGTHALNGTGWGEEDVWASMESGCIAWPFAWSGDAPGEPYGNPNSEVDMSQTMRITVVCPDPERGTTDTGDISSTIPMAGVGAAMGLAFASLFVDALH